MSYWTYIRAIVDITIFNPIQCDMDFINEMMELAPKITGSEGNAQVTVIRKNQSHTESSCEFCPFRKSIRWQDASHFSCLPVEGYQCKFTEYYDSYSIIIIGNLRDKFKEETKKEFNEFKHWISTSSQGLNWGINKVLCDIDGRYSWEAFPPRGSLKKLVSIEDCKSYLD